MAKKQRFTVRVRRGLDKILTHHQERITEHAREGLTADEKRDVDAALEWMGENGEARSG